MAIDPTGITHLWEHSALPSIEDYIRIPNQSPAFDADWATNGHLDRAVDHVATWCRGEVPDRMSVEVERLPGRTPVIVMELPGEAPGTVLLYGHVDKQPPMTGWEPGLGPYEPVLRDGRLYGRGGADDGYSAYATVLALRALAESGTSHARCIVLIEASEESGSPDLPAYLDHLADRIGTPDLVICLDSGCGNYEQLWATTSLRGTVGAQITVEVLEEGVHSGDAGGVVPDSFRILRQLLERVEDMHTGDVKLETAHVDIPGERRQQAEVAASQMGSEVTERFPFVDDAGPVTDDPVEAILNRTWRPALAVHGADGLPAVHEAGAVLRPGTTLKLSVRIPPTADADAVVDELRRVLTADPPAGAAIRVDVPLAAPGWSAPRLAPWLAAALEEASQVHFDQPALYMGEGGTIPFMAMLGQRFPDAQFVITGVLGPHSNAHGPNEFLHVETARRLTGCVADVIVAHGHRT